MSDLLSTDLMLTGLLF